MDEIDITEMRIQKEYAEFFKQRQHTSFNIEGNGLCVVCKGIVSPVIVNDKSIIGRWCSVECRNVWSERHE